MQPYEELSLLIESIEDDLARAARSRNVALTRQFAQELRACFSIYRDACADAGIAWAIRSQRTERKRTGGALCLSQHLSVEGENGALPQVDEFKHVHQERRHPWQLQ